MNEIAKQPDMEVTKSLSTANRGSALIITLGYLAAVTIFASVFLTLLNRTMSNFTQKETKRIAFHIAEGGMDKAIAELRHGRGDYRGEVNVPLGRGRFSVEVNRSDSPEKLQIISTGEVVDGERVISRIRITAEVTIEPSGELRSIVWSGVGKQ